MHILTCQYPHISIECKPKEGPGSGGLCIFPFKYHGTSQNGCIWEDAAPGKPWCSTKVDKQGNHVENEGNWGICGEECSILRKA